jgi:hypothetical protein
MPSDGKSSHCLWQVELKMDPTNTKIDIHGEKLLLLLTDIILKLTYFNFPFHRKFYD